MIGFVGLSHLGTVSSIAIASKGFEVLAYDPNSDLVADLNRGKPSVHEPELNELLAASKNKITFTNDAKKLALCDVVYVSLDVKTDQNNESDLGPLRGLIAEVSAVLTPTATLVVLSQVPPGFSRKLSSEIKNTLFYQVETLIFGRAVERATRPERYIVGCADPAKPLPRAFSALLKAFDCPILPMRYESAELAKISINMCLVSSISVANTLAEICEKTGAEWTEIAPALKLDKRIGQFAYLSPGLGIAGGNLERDLATILSLAKEHGTDGRVVVSWISNNRYRLDWVLRTLHSEVLSKQDNPTIGVWGLAYKQDTKSIKNSPSLHFLDSIKGTVIQTYDPAVVMDHSKKSALEACAGAHALVIMTPWKEFGAVDLEKVKASLKGQTVIDPYAVLNPDRCEALGFKYFRLGSKSC